MVGGEVAGDVGGEIRVRVLEEEEAAGDGGFLGVGGGEDEEGATGGVVEEEEGGDEGGEGEARGEHHQAPVRVLHEIRHDLLLER